MVVEWREREHGDDNDAILNDPISNHPGAINALLQCGMLKIFKVPNMIKAQKATSEEVNRILGSSG